jgi:hypothetical protein
MNTMYNNLDLLCPLHVCGLISLGLSDTKLPSKLWLTLLSIFINQCHSFLPIELTKSFEGGLGTHGTSKTGLSSA